MQIPGFGIHRDIAMARILARANTSKASAMLAFCLLSSPSPAHDFWTTGEPVPPWIKRYCCADNEVHRIEPGHVHLRAEGYHIDGYPDAVPENRVYASRDSSFWAFFRIRDNGRPGTIWCFFAPPNT
jgi:hypothetical protein